MKNRWEFIKKIKKEDYLVLLLAGVLLLIIALPTKKQKAEETFLDAGGRADEMEQVSGEAYGEYWEKRLEQILPAMEGVGRVRVLLSLEDEGELFVEKDTPVSRSTTKEQDCDGGTREVTEYSGTENTLMVTQKDGKQTPYVVRESKPKVTGILVLAQGGDNERIRKEITCLLQALFDIEAHKIVVAKMKSG